MGETEKEPQANREGRRKEAESPEARRSYVAPEVTVLEMRTVIKGPSGRLGDQFNSRQP